jgi:hypothetical protein
MTRFTSFLTASLVPVVLVAAALMLARPVAAEDAKTRAKLQFTLIVYETKTDFAARIDPEKAKAYWGAFAVFGDELKKAGVLAGGQVFEPPTTAATVTVRAGKVETAHRPYHAGDTQIGGYFVIEVASAEEAAKWAAQCPGATTGAVEVRLNMDMSRMMTNQR